mmetsp:Transcript_15069/g.46887  ORF Transcript_15069/g.46887 Transcript_15069/m.46887 type:complete len:212 (+) Transcript_15069:730-1365(+)
MHHVCAALAAPAVDVVHCLGCGRHLCRIGIEDGLVEDVDAPLRRRRVLNDAAECLLVAPAFLILLDRVPQMPHLQQQFARPLVRAEDGEAKVVVVEVARKHQVLGGKRRPPCDCLGRSYFAEQVQLGGLEQHNIAVGPHNPLVLGQLLEDRRDFLPLGAVARLGVRAVARDMARHFFGVRGAECLAVPLRSVQHLLRENLAALALFPLQAD